MRALLGAALLASALSGCALQRAYTTLTDLSVSPKLVIVAANGFDAVEATAKNIIVLCTPASPPAQCNDAQIHVLIGAVQAGRKARDGLEGFMTSHPGTLGSQGLYDALVASTKTITAAVAAYNGAS